MFEKTDLLESPPASLPSAANSDVATSPAGAVAVNEKETIPNSNSSTPAMPQHAEPFKTEYLKSLKRKVFTASATMSLYQKRLRKRARLQKIINLNKNFKYNNSLSSSSSFSSLSSNSSSISKINEDLNTEIKRAKTDPPLKLHKFYHSVPFKCPFCFTFKDSDMDFVDHLATAHHSDVKLLYEKKCLTIMENLNIKKQASMISESFPLQENKIQLKAENNSDTETNNKDSDINCMQTTDPIKVNTTNKALYTSSTLPPRKQQRLLKSPINDAQEIVQSYPQIQQQLQKQQKSHIKSENFLNFYFDNSKPSIHYSASQSQAQPGFMPNSSIDTSFQSDNRKSLATASAAASSILNQPSNTYYHQTNSANNCNSYVAKNYSVLSAANDASMKCAICDRGFEYYSNLRRHIKTKHKIFGKQVKEYVIRYQSNSNNNSASKVSNHNSSENLNKQNIDESNCLSTSPDQNASSSLKNSDSNNNNANSIMMMSPQSGASSQQSNNHNVYSSSYMDLGLMKNKSRSNGKNSPLSSMSSSSMCSIISMTKSQKLKKKSMKTDDSFETDMDQAGEDNVSSNGLYTGFSLNNKVSAMQPLGAGNANIAAMAAAMAGMNANVNIPDLNSFMSHSGQTGMNSQMLSLLNNHANAMSQIKSNLLENLLQRKLPNKFNNGLSTQHKQQNDIASMAAAVVAASLASQQNSTLLSPDAESITSKTNHLNKLLQNIADMNNLQHTKVCNTNNVASLASSSPSSSSASSSSSEIHEKSSIFMNTNNTSQLNNELSELNDNEFMEKQQQHKNWNGDEVLDEEDSNQDGISDEKHEAYYDNDDDIDDEQSENDNNKQLHLIENECDEKYLRSRSPSNSSKSSGCSSMSSLIQNQFLNQQKHQQHNHKLMSGNNSESVSGANKLFMNHLAGCITPPINQMTIENHLKNFTQQQQRQHMIQQQPHYQPHGNYNSYNTNGVKRKKSKEFAAMNSFMTSIGTMDCMRNGKQSPSDINGSNEPTNHMIDGSVISPSCKLDASSSNQIRYSSEIWRCPYCCYETTSASRYNSHLVCHGWKPYLCPHCGSRSNRLPDMRTHISTFHPEFNVNTFVVLGEEEAKSTLKDYMKNRALINRKLKEMRPQPKFKCKLCPYASLYQFNLTKHVKSVHLNEIYNHNNNNASRNGATLSVGDANDS